MTATCPHCGTNEVKIVRVKRPGRPQEVYCEGCFGNEAKSA